MNINEVKAELINTFKYNLTCTRHEDKVTPMIWSAPGIGKSDIVYQIAEEIGYTVVELRLSSLNPVDVRGFPVEDKEKGKGKFLLPFYFPAEGENPKIILFLDEFNTALPTNQVTAYEIFQNYSVGGQKFPNEVLIVGAGNREEDGGITFEMATPIANRLQHFDVSPDVKAFVKYGFEHGLREEILAFVQFKPSLLHKMPESEKAFPTPRSWTKLSNISGDQPIRKLSAESLVGKGAAAELMAFIEVRKELPDLDEALEKGETFTSSDKSVMFSFVTGISYRVKKDPENPEKVKNFFKIIEKVPRELAALAIHMTLESIMDTVVEEGIDYVELFERIQIKI